MASDLADKADTEGDMGAVSFVASLLRVMRLQAKAAHDRAHAQWMAACAAELDRQGGASMKSTSTPPAPPLRAVAAQPLTHAATDELQTLRSAVQMADALSQGGMSKIASIARVVLKSLELPGGETRLEDIAQALITIEEIASLTEDQINSHAEEVGCNYLDDRAGRRMDARRAARAGREST
jgi:hypothetical protein